MASMSNGNFLPYRSATQRNERFPNNPPRHAIETRSDACSVVSGPPSSCDAGVCKVRKFDGAQAIALPKDSGNRFTARYCAMENNN